MRLPEDLKLASPGVLLVVTERDLSLRLIPPHPSLPVRMGAAPFLLPHASFCSPMEGIYYLVLLDFFGSLKKRVFVSKSKALHFGSESLVTARLSHFISL